MVHCRRNETLYHYLFFKIEVYGERKSPGTFGSNQKPSLSEIILIKWDQIK